MCLRGHFNIGDFIPITYICVLLSGRIVVSHPATVKQWAALIPGIVHVRHGSVEIYVNYSVL